MLTPHAHPRRTPLPHVRLPTPRTCARESVPRVWRARICRGDDHQRNARKLGRIKTRRPSLQPDLPRDWDKHRALDALGHWASLVRTHIYADPRNLLHRHGSALPCWMATSTPSETKWPFARTLRVGIRPRRSCCSRAIARSARSHKRNHRSSFVDRFREATHASHVGHERPIARRRWASLPHHRWNARRTTRDRSCDQSARETVSASRRAGRPRLTRSAASTSQWQAATPRVPPLL